MQKLTQVARKQAIDDLEAAHNHIQYALSHLRGVYRPNKAIDVVWAISHTIDSLDFHDKTVVLDLLKELKDAEECNLKLCSREE